MLCTINVHGQVQVLSLSISSAVCRPKKVNNENRIDLVISSSISYVDYSEDHSKNFLGIFPKYPDLYLFSKLSFSMYYSGAEGSLGLGFESAFPFAVAYGHVSVPLFQEVDLLIEYFPTPVFSNCSPFGSADFFWEFTLQFVSSWSLLSNLRTSSRDIPYHSSIQATASLCPANNMSLIFLWMKLSTLDWKP